MALQMRLNCEFCDKDLPPDSEEARSHLHYRKEEISQALRARLEDIPPEENRSCESAITIIVHQRTFSLASDFSDQR